MKYLKENPFIQNYEIDDLDCDLEYKKTKMNMKNKKFKN